MGKKLSNVEFLEEIKTLHKNTLSKFEEKVTREISSALKLIPTKIKTITSALDDLHSVVEEEKLAFNKFQERVESLEESLLYIMHNIKKNQFLYSHYPEEWVNNYQSIKNGLIDENKFMEKKIG